MEAEWTVVETKKKPNGPKKPLAPHSSQTQGESKERQQVLRSRNPLPGQQPQQKGIANVQKKVGAVKNVNRSQDTVARVLEKDTGNYSVQRSGPKMGKEIIKKRNELGLTQKDLGLKIDEKASLVSEYEQGLAIPNLKVITKFEKALDCQLKHLIPKKDKTTDDVVPTSTTTV